MIGGRNLPDVLSEPTLTSRAEDGRHVPLLVWRADVPLRAVSSAPLGGGIGVRQWVLNATVPMSYDRDDPAAHLAALAAELALDGPGVGLLTGVDVTEVVARTDTGVRAWATVGLGTPVPAAAPTPAALAQRVGTVNIVVYVPARLADSALVNAVATATEAKTQAISELGVPGTGTPTDAVTVLCPVGRAGGRVRRAALHLGRPAGPSGARGGARRWFPAGRALVRPAHGRKVQPIGCRRRV